MIKGVNTLLILLTVVVVLVGRSDIAQASSDFGATVNVAQQSGEDLLSCENLDVVFIVDQSDSMSYEGHGSDPLKNRKYAISAMIDLLVDLAVDQCADSTYRVAVISFGSQGATRVDLPLRNINPNDIEEGQVIREALVSNLKADRLGQTYPKDAFYDAQQILNSASRYGDKPRKRVILFLTDGVPCSEGRDGCDANHDFDGAASDVASYVSRLFPFEKSLLDAEACLAKLRQENDGQELPAEPVNDCLKAMPDNKLEVYERSTYIYTILMKSEDSYLQSTLDILGRLSNEHAGRLVELKRNQGDIPATMREILSELVGIRPNLLQCGNPFAVNPYLKRLRVNVYNISDTNQITLSYIDAEGNTREIKGGNSDGGFTLSEPYYAFGANERYVFQYPFPGLWKITAENCEGVDIYAEPINFEADPYQPNLPPELPEFDAEPYYSGDTNFQYILKYQMRQGEDVIPQAAQSLFAIGAEARVTAPDGREFIYPMEYDEAAKEFVAAEPLKLPVDGVYQLSLVGATLRHKGDIVVPANLSMEQVFTENEKVFEFQNQIKVFPVSPFILDPVSPLPNQKINHVHGTILDDWPLPETPLSVRVRVADRSGAALSNLDDIFSDKNQAITATLNGGPSVTLYPDPQTPGEYIGDIQSPAVLGEQSLVFNVNMGVVNPEYRPDRQSWEIPMERGDGLFHRTITYFIILWTIIAGILALIAYNIAIRTNKVSGSLIFLDGTENIAEFGLYNGTNFRTIRGQELENYPQLLLKRMKVRNVGSKRRTTQQQDEASGGLYSDEASIQVDCVSADGRKFPVILYPKMPVIYSDETMAQMIYEPVE